MHLYSSTDFGKCNSFFQISLVYFWEIKVRISHKGGMWVQYDSNGAEVLRTAARKARAMGHSYVGTAHLLLALGEEPGLPAMLLTGSGLDVQTAQRMAEVLYGKGCAGLPLPQGFSAQMRRVLHRAGSEAKLLQDRLVRPVHLLLALLRQGKADAGDLHPDHLL